MNKMIYTNPNILRIAHYNILNGGEKQLENIFTVIKEIKPDICGILEAVGWQDKQTYLEEIAKNLGYDFYRLALANSEYNIAIFSKLPIEITTIKEGIRHVILQAVVKEGLFEGLGFFFVHLSPVSEDARLLETEKLLEHIAKFPKGIIMGDFNSLSPHDPYDRDTLLDKFKKNEITKYGVGQLQFNVIEKIESAGLIDAMRYLKIPFDFSTPTPSNQDINHTAEVRIDYAFLTPECIQSLYTAEFLKNNLTDKTSDHYPFIIELHRNI